jgi:sigma-E factor negative regulatory protein RseA
MMNQQHLDSSVNIELSALESLSACMDGELTDAGQEQLLDRIKAQPAGAPDCLRSDWSLYHCIGDALRSDELATRPAGFNARLAERLAAEPYVYAPQVARANAARYATGRRWFKPASLAASVAAVAVVAGMVMLQTGSKDGGPQIAQTAQTPAPTQVAEAVPVAVPSAYVAAHRQYASGLAVPGTPGLVRTAAHDSEK